MLPEGCQKDGCRTRAYWRLWYRQDGSDAINVCRNHLHMAASRLELFRLPGTEIKLIAIR